MSTTLIDDVPMVFPFDSPRARRTDPVESHRAADSSDRAGSSREVMSWLSLNPDGLTDTEIEELHVRSRTKAGHVPYTGSRLRTARAEMVTEGRVVRVGDGMTPRGRNVREMGSGMTNVIAFPKRPAPVTPIRSEKTFEPKMLTETVDGMFDRGVLPKAGDYIFYIEFRAADEACVVFSSGGSGQIDRATHLPNTRSITVHFKDGGVFTLAGTTRVKWYPEAE